MRRAVHAAWVGPLALLMIPASASAFCGFYVGGAETSLYNEGSMVVLMRDGETTVVSMQNDYKGPAEDFALVIPVPEILEEEQVRTLEREVFDHVDRLAAPRLVEYWEQDPCPEPAMDVEVDYASVEPTAERESDDGDDDDYEEPRDLGVRVEAEFAVGEYDIVILSAEYSAGLDTWLRRNGYRIPEGAERVLRPYVEQDMKFFVAKVNMRRVEYADGQAVLSPLRFHYDAHDFFLPIRLGLLNSPGEQDVIVHVLARGMRYEVANYDNYAIPTNLVVSNAVRDGFGAFYDALFTRMHEAHPRSVITEYAWNAGSCDPCPDPPLEPDEVVSLGADVIPAYSSAVRDGRVQTGFSNDFVLTRMHIRVSAEGAGEDLYFRPGPPIEGGRGTPDMEGQMSRGMRSYGVNNFQGRYAILHEWEGPIECEVPRRGIWGGPPSTQRASNQPLAAAGLAFATTASVSLEGYLTSEIPELGADTDTLPQGDVTPPPPPPPPPGGGCASCAVEDGREGPANALLALGVLALMLRRRSR